MSLKNPKNRSGFTLLEMLSVFGILLVLGGLGIYFARGFLESGRRDRSRSELLVLQHSLEAYKSEFGDYPRRPTTFAGPPSDMEEVLFNALNGKLSPNGDAVAYRSFIDNSSLTLETGNYPNPNNSNSVANRILDPWGFRYQYRFNPNDGNWKNFGYVLFSMGADGAFTDVPNDGYKNPTASDNGDNFYTE